MHPLPTAPAAASATTTASTVSEQQGRTPTSTPSSATPSAATPPQTPGPTPTGYRHDPYRGKILLYGAIDTASRDLLLSAEAEPLTTAPSLLHSRLRGRVAYHPFPPARGSPQDERADDGEVAEKGAAGAAGPDATRLFFGQLPYELGEARLRWLCARFGGGAHVLRSEAILKRLRSKVRLPTGCMHVYVAPAAVQGLEAGLHKRVLVDEDGVWHASTAAEAAELADYVAELKANPDMRTPQRPYDTVVVQPATSAHPPPPPKGTAKAAPQLPSASVSSSSSSGTR